MTTLEIVEATLGQMVTAIKEDQSLRGIIASGKSAGSLSASSSPTGGDISGASYIYFQIYGRGPGGFPPLQSILEWIESKGIEPVDISKKSLAFLIARKIARLGTNIFSGKSPALALSTIVQEGAASAAQAIANVTREEILDMFRSLNTNRN
jgi:hypothetical protein